MRINRGENKLEDIEAGIKPIDTINLYKESRQ